MKLYNSPQSPFGVRVKIALGVKAVPFEELGPPGGGLKSPEYLAINPLGKLPVLVTDGGLAIAESEAILRYLEDRFPAPSLLPADAEARARLNLAVRVMETYVVTPITRLFAHLNPAVRDERVVEQELARWREGLAVLARFMAEPLPGAEAGVSLADCVLAPSFHLSALIARMLGVQEDLLASHLPLAAYYERMNAHPVVGKALADLTAAQSAH